MVDYKPKYVKVSNTDNEDYNILIEIAKAIPLFILGIALLWVMAWFFNICIWIIFGSIDSIIQSVVIYLVSTFIYSGVETIWNTFFSFVMMLPFVCVYCVAIMPMGYILKPGLLTSILYLIMGVITIFLFDPEMKYHILSSPLFDNIEFLQNEWHFYLIGPPDIIQKTWSREITSFEYILFDIFTAVATLFFTVFGYFNKMELG